MNPSRIEQTIEDIYAFIEECKTSKLYPNKVVVAKDELYDMLDALRLCAPEEIKRYQKIITNRDQILTEAQQRAEEMVNKAQAETNQILDQSELVQAADERAREILDEAVAQANQIIANANEDSEQIQNAALVYTGDLLSQAERSVSESLSEANAKYRMLVSALQSNLDIIRANKEELVPKKEEPAVEEVPVEQAVDEAVAATESDE